MKNLRNKLKVIHLVLIMLILVLGVAAFAVANRNNTDRTEPQVEGVDLGPASESDRNEAERHKEELIDTPKETSSAGSKTVSPQITSWGQSNEMFELAARIPGVFEDGGQCKLTLSKDTRTVVGSSSATRNVSDVSCGFIKIPLSKLTPGNWSASVSYTSDTAQGTSGPKEVTVE